MQEQSLIIFSLAAYYNHYSLFIYKPYELAFFVHEGYDHIRMYLLSTALLNYKLLRILLIYQFFSANFCTMSNNNSYTHVKYIWDQFDTISLPETKVTSFLQGFHRISQLMIILFCTTKTLLPTYHSLEAIMTLIFLFLYNFELKIK